MKILKISKGGGKFRTIYIPSKEKRHELRKVAWDLSMKASKLPHANVAHGFTPGRSAVTNALAHVGKAWTWTADLKSCFDNIKPEHLKQHLTKEQMQVCIVDGAPRQGLPTSPACCNLALHAMDRAIIRAMKKHGITDVIYTRYADDLTFSGDIEEHIAGVKKIAEVAAKRCGHTLAKGKSRLYRAQAGRRVVCGVSVGSKGVHPTRRARRKLRAAKHRDATSPNTRGLAEWCKLRRPSMAHAIRAEVTQVADAWNISRKRVLAALNVRVKHAQQPETIGPRCIITSDPVYILGCSSITTGWKSCLKHPGGKYRQSTRVYLGHRGVRIALYLSDKDKIVNGVRRKAIAARAWVYTLTDGRTVYDRPYGGPEAVKVLRTHLHAAGVHHISEAKDIRVSWECPAEARRGVKRIWSDGCRSIRGKNGGLILHTCK